MTNKRPRLHTASGQPLEFHTLPRARFCNGFVREGAKPDRLQDPHINGEGQQTRPFVPARYSETAYRDTSAATGPRSDRDCKTMSVARAALVNWLTFEPDHTADVTALIAIAIWPTIVRPRHCDERPDDFGVYGAATNDRRFIRSLANQFVRRRNGRS